ncbi:outer membrane lipoprotein carrier protein LolA [Acetobacter sp. AN02]|nr:outer membrane lipoprotein carrier protein LolA [Acetobacter sp. AN02]MDG6095548.1 outer membrane lipoprotein carrier protein LolA [Acetobacter sp. AN02]
MSSVVPQARAQEAAAVLTPADRGWLARIEDQLNTVTTLQARFRQVAPDRAVTNGTVWLSRPGKMRFEYDKPSPLLLVASGGKVVFRDSQLDQTTEIPQERTPLGLLLGSHVAFSGPVTVTGFSHQGGFIHVTVVRTASPGDGSLTLVFREAPLALVSWTVLDAQGRQTEVSLSDIRPGAPAPASLFVLPRGG